MDMKLTYIYHSCFTIETDACSLIFDYFKDTGDVPDRGYVHDSLLKKDVRLYVLASHFHPDHFNRRILEWKDLGKDIVYIFSEDILAEGKAKDDDAVFIRKNDVWEDENVRIQALGSTDVGVSFLLNIEGRRIFHAGDLNNWHWKDESSPEYAAEAERLYLSELEDVAAAADSIDLAMFPIDPRLGRDYMRGAEQFVSRIRTLRLAPMHFGESYEAAGRFNPVAEREHCSLLRLYYKGESFTIK
jgi:L-ascorbate metabolism protein UlaG (beta-lactamase superfamily)